MLLPYSSVDGFGGSDVPLRSLALAMTTTAVSWWGKNFSQYQLPENFDENIGAKEFISKLGLNRNPELSSSSNMILIIERTSLE